MSACKQLVFRYDSYTKLCLAGYLILYEIFMDKIFMAKTTKSTKNFSPRKVLGYIWYFKGRVANDSLALMFSQSE